MFIDSHCHIDFPQLRDQFTDVLARMQHNQVEHALVVSVDMDAWPALIQLVEQSDQLSASIGVHPGYQDVTEPTADELIQLAQHPKVVAIGETGLDYYRLSEPLDWQRERFERHLWVSRQTGLPSIIHTRSAAKDTLAIMRAAQAQEVGGVMHCFTETKEVAKAAMDMNFYISFSGIVTFKNAIELQDVARYVPLDRMLIETDSPYLAPVPVRGQTNEPAYVKYVAECIAQLRGVALSTIAEATTQNFYNLFKKA